MKNGFVSKAAFATIYGCKPSYVTKLIGLQRIVLDEAGKLVNVDASLRLIESTGDPSKAGVRERWEAYRSGNDLAEVPSAAQKAEAVPMPQEHGKRSAEGAGSEYHKARTKKEQIETQLKEIELRKQMGEIAEVAPIVRAIVDTHTAARTAVLQLPDRLAQILASETDPAKAHEILRLECERICDTIARDIQRLRDRAGLTEEV